MAAMCKIWKNVHVCADLDIIVKMGSTKVQDVKSSCEKKYEKPNTNIKNKAKTKKQQCNPVQTHKNIANKIQCACTYNYTNGIKINYTQILKK